MDLYVKSLICHSKVSGDLVSSFRFLLVSCPLLDLDFIFRVCVYTQANVHNCYVLSELKVASGVQMHYIPHTTKVYI